MSEDEVIKQLQYLKDRKINTGDWLINCKDRTAIEIILDLYKQEKEKNKNLIKQLQEQNTEIQDISKQLREKEKEVVLVPEGTCFMMKPKNSIRKDKIKAKIDYYKKIDNAVGVKILERILEEE